MAPLRTAPCTSATEPPITIIRNAAITPVASSATERVGEPRSSATERRAAGSLDRRAVVRASSSRRRAVIGRQMTIPAASPTSAPTVLAGLSSATSTETQMSARPQRTRCDQMPAAGA